MPVSFTLPLFEGKPSSLKDKIFTVLVTKFPLSLIQILNALKDMYAVAPSFQAVRKAVLELVDAKVLSKNGKLFSISKDWILGLSQYSTMLQKQYFMTSKTHGAKKIEIGPNVTVFSFSNLLDLDTFSNSIILEQFAKKTQKPKYMIYEAAHFWFVVVSLAQETALVKEILEKGVKIYYLCKRDTELDRWTIKHYQDIGINCKFMQSKDFPLGYTIGVYDELVMCVTHPPEIASALDKFFQEHKSVEKADLTKLFEIVKMPCEMKLTVIKDSVLANTVRENILKNF